MISPERRSSTPTPPPDGSAHISDPFHSQYVNGVPVVAKVEPQECRLGTRWLAEPSGPRNIALVRCTTVELAADRRPPLEQLLHPFIISAVLSFEDLCGQFLQATTAPATTQPGDRFHELPGTGSNRIF